MEAAEMLPTSVKKTEPTPKAVIHQKYGNKACYTVEEVKEEVENGCPGLVISRKSRSLFRCHLELPEFSVISDAFTRKKDAEQAAAKMALDQLGVQPEANNPTFQEIWDQLVSRLSYLFRDEFLSTSRSISCHPLIGHFRAALQREGDFYCCIPISILAVCDVKLMSLCKSINLKAESSPPFIISLVMKAASTSHSICVSEEKLWIWRKIPCAAETVQAFINDTSCSSESAQIEVLLVPCSLEKPVEPLSLKVSSKEYYLDVIAQKLGVGDCSQVLISRTIGKASSEMRLYFPASENQICVSESSLEELSHANRIVSPQSNCNVRASYFSGQSIYGNAILATVGYTWKSTELYYEDVPLGSYYRLLIGRTPDGNYKLSRKAILAAELPTAFTARSNWRGLFPRELLSMFCRQHHLLEPDFSVNVAATAGNPTQVVETFKKLKSSTSTDIEFANGVVDSHDGELGGQSTFHCEVRLLSKDQGVILQCSTEDSCRKQSDAIQNAALKILTWLNKYFKELDMPLEKLSSSGHANGIHVESQRFSREFALCASVHIFQQKSAAKKYGSVDRFARGNGLNIKQGNEVIIFDVEGPESGISPSAGSLTCISYTVSLMREGRNVGEPLESLDEFEFEVGTGGVIPLLESCVTQLSVNQSAHFISKIPSEELIFSTFSEAAKAPSELSLGDCCLEYFIKVLRVTEPMEDRMEQALFSPPLSKQRVEYALRRINESQASTLVDFGCGSGSLLDSLLDHPSTLEKIVGVDISLKSLARAAKVLHSKLSMAADASKPCARIKSAVLYDGSITDFDSRVYGFDIGTCLEVIEHMEEDQACLFGDIVLSSFCPQLLIVSTPNYEYNPILQRNALLSKDEEPDEKSQSAPFRFRNLDHKFEWTREQFNRWASDLAMKHGYSVEFSGVGGTAGVEPGFASQIAVFKRSMLHRAEIIGDPSLCYDVIWEWTNSNP